MPRSTQTDPALAAVGWASISAGGTAMIASQIELIVRADGDYSFWGFAIIASVGLGVLIGSGVGFLALGAWVVESALSLQALARAAVSAACVLIGGGVVIAGWGAARGGWMVPTGLAAVVVASAVCVLATFLIRPRVGEVLPD